MVGMTWQHLGLHARRKTNAAVAYETVLHLKGSIQDADAATVAARVAVNDGATTYAHRAGYEHYPCALG